MRRATAISLFIFCLLLGVVLLKVSSMSGPARYEAHMYVSYQYNVLKHPTALLMLDGYLYIADTDNHRIRRFTPASPGATQTLQVVAGSGTAGYANGGLGTAQFNHPVGLVGKSRTYIFLDPLTYTYRQTYQHDIYVNDSQNYVVRKICANVGPPPTSTPQGNPPYGLCNTVSTVAGNNVKGMVDGPSLSSCFRSLAGMSDVNGACYIADAENHSIRKWDGSNVTTYAGSGYPGYVNGYRTSARFYVPGKITNDASGNTYVADIENHCIRKINTAGTVTTFAGAGPNYPGYVNGNGTAACFTRPTSIVFNPADNMMYVADSNNNVIRRIDSAGNVTTYAGTGAPGLVNGNKAQAKFSTPTDLLIYNGFMYISDTINNVIRRIDMATGIVSTYIS